MSNKVNLINKNQMVYIPAYVEQGIIKLDDVLDILNDITRKINRGISIINSSGYNRGIPHIEKGDIVANAIAQMENTINVITTELEKYNRGKVILDDDAIIIANPRTAWRYRLNKEKIDYTIDEYLNLYGVKPKWEANHLTASAGGIKYLGKDGRITKETWCDLNPNNLARLMRKQGIDLDYWIREDGVYMYGDYVMVAADIPHMDGTQQAAEYRKGDLVETSLGTGMVVDLCGMAEMVRKGELKGTAEGDVEVWYDIYTAWHDDGKYEHIGYCKDPTCISTHNPQRTMISPSQTNGGQTTLSAPVNIQELTNDDNSIVDVITNAVTNNPIANKVSDVVDAIAENPVIEKVGEIKDNITSVFTPPSNQSDKETLGNKITDFITNNLFDKQPSNDNGQLAGSLSNLARNYQEKSKNDYVIPRVDNDTTSKVETAPFLEGIGLASIAGLAAKIQLDKQKEEQAEQSAESIEEDILEI